MQNSKINYEELEYKKIGLTFFTEEEDDFFTYEDGSSTLRQKKALTEKFNVIEKNNGLKIALIQDDSGKKYTTSLDACTCKTYIQDHEACKHMYFWANELRVFNLEWGLLYTPKREKFFEKLEGMGLSPKAFKKLKYILKNFFDPEILLKKSNIIQELLQKNLIIDITDREKILKEHLTKNDIVINNLPEIRDKLTESLILVKLSNEISETELLAYLNRQSYIKNLSNKANY